ncbi:MAG: TolC family protein [Limisphaerales bacterium]
MSVSSAVAQTNVVRPMSLEEAIRLALQQNFDVQIEQYSTRIARFNYEVAEAAYYDPNFELSAIHRNNTRPGGLNPATGEPFPATTSENTTVSAGIVGALPTGLTYNFGPSLTHSEGSSRGVAFDPFYEGQVGISLRQPLLRNFLIDAGRRNILVSRKNIEITEHALASQIMRVISQVEQTYYDLIFARENINVQQKALELAERLVAENRRRVEVGTLAPLEQTQSESQAAERRADLISAQGNYQVQQNALKSLITDSYREWHNVEISPTETLLAIPEQFDVMESWRRGMANRPDLAQLRADLERRDVILRYQRNQVLPALDLVGSYGRSGLGDDISDVARDIRREDNPSYSVGAVLSVPLSRRGPRSAYNATKAENEQAKLRLQAAEQTVMVQIDNAIKVARTNLERVEATRAARQYAEQALAAEERRLEAGRSTSFVVLQLQRDLTRARSEEIRAIADYNKALSQIAFSEGSTLVNNNLGLSVRR